MGLRKLKRNKKQKKKTTDPLAVKKFFDGANEHKVHGRLDKAVTLYKKFLGNIPDHAEALNNLANTLHLQGKLQEAIHYYQKACTLLPGNPDVLYNYGTALYEAGEIQKAIEMLLQATTSDPAHAKAYASLGVAYQANNELDKARSSLETAIRLNPNYREAHRFLGLVLKNMGDIPQAVSQLNKTLLQWPEDAFTRYISSRYTTYKSEEDAGITTILSLLDKKETSSYDTVFHHFTLGKIYDDLGKFDKAFQHYTQGNLKKRASFSKSTPARIFELRSIRSVFTPDLFKRFSSQGSNSELPVFIVGMPRSGTSLVEQICASHSAVHGKGELKLIGNLIDSKLKGYPECLATINPDTITPLSQEYLYGLRHNVSSGTIRITDKMPTNFMVLGLIRILFPRARIIHCIRNPLDTCLSNYFQNFEEGNECSFHIEELALFFRKYQAVMDFWKNVLPGEYCEIHYEKLIDNCEEEARRLIHFLGLPWEENCLTFFLNKRMVHTASDYQVRQPIYTKSVQRWKNYEPYLGALKKALASKSSLI